MEEALKRLEKYIQQSHILFINYYEPICKYLSTREVSKLQFSGQIQPAIHFWK